MSNLPYTYERTLSDSGDKYFTGFVLGVILTLAFACQQYAWLLGHHSNIGTPIVWLSDSSNVLIRVGVVGSFLGGLGAMAYNKFKVGSFFWILSLFGLIFSFEAVYNPLLVVQWVYSYWDIPQLSNENQTLALCSGGYFIVALTTIFIQVKGSAFKASGAHGTAALENGDALQEGNPQTQQEKAGLPVKFKAVESLLSLPGLKGFLKPYHEKKLKEGIIIGRHIKSNKLLRYRGDRHLFSIAPTRSGKGVGLVIPNLLTYPNNVVVVDTKGDNCDVTWERREDLGQDIYVLDPFNESTYAKVKGSNKINPLDYVDPDNPKNAIDICDEISMAILPKAKKTSGSNNDHWQLTGGNLLSGLIYYVSVAPKYNDSRHDEFEPNSRDLSSVFSLLNQPEKELTRRLKRIIRDPELPEEAKYFANSILNKQDKERSSIISTAEENLKKFMKNPLLRESLAESDFDIDEVLTTDSTLYIILPESKVRSYNGYLRLIVNLVINRSLTVKDTLTSSVNNKKTLFLLDEFRNLGYLQTIETAYTLLAGSGFTFWIFVQNLANIKALYRDEFTTFKANAGIFNSFNTNDVSTAEYLAREAGETTVVTESQSANRRKAKAGISRRSGDSTSIRESRRKVLTPDEIKRIPDDHQLIFRIGDNPALAKKIYFYKDPFFKNKYRTVEQIEKEKIEAEKLIIEQEVDEALKERNQNYQQEVNEKDNVPVQEKGKEKESPKEPIGANTLGPIVLDPPAVKLEDDDGGEDINDATDEGENREDEFNGSDVTDSEGGNEVDEKVSDFLDNTLEL